MTSNVNKPDQFGRGTSSAPDDEKILNDEKPLPPVTGSISQPKAVDSEVVYRKQPGGLKLAGFDIVELPPRNLYPPADGKPDVGLVDPLPVKSLDPNRYATKKTIAQGMLDIALLTANASQLKYILQIGKQHEFYTLMLTLICLSIGLQILSGLLSLSLNLMLDRNMENGNNGLAVEWIGLIRVALSFVVFLDNILIAAFDPMGLSSLMLFSDEPALSPKNL